MTESWPGIARAVKRSSKDTENSENEKEKPRKQEPVNPLQQHPSRCCQHPHQLQHSDETNMYFADTAAWDESRACDARCRGVALNGLDARRHVRRRCARRWIWILARRGRGRDHHCRRGWIPSIAHAGRIPSIARGGRRGCRVH